MNKFQLWDKALDQEASYEVNKIWQTNGHWFNRQLKNSLNLTENLHNDASLLLAVARLLNWIILLDTKNKLSSSLFKIFYTHSPQSIVQRYGESKKDDLNT